MPAIHYVQCNSVVETTRRKNLFESVEWDSHDCLIESLSLRTKPLEVLNGNVGIEPQRKVHYLFGHLSKVGLDIIGFGSPKPLKCFDRIEGLQFGASSHYLLSSGVDMPAKISLIQNLASWRYDTDGKLFCVDVNPKDILPHWQFDVFFGQISDNLKVAGQSVGLASPSIKKKVNGISANPNS